jgi:hypothetical protein
MPIVRESFGQPFPAHRLHGNAIRKAVALVGPRTVELQTSTEGIPALWNNPYDGVRQQILDNFRRLAACRRWRCTEKRKVFGQHLVGRDDLSSRPLGGQLQCRLVGAIGGVSKCNPVKGVGEKRGHTSRFGQP